MLSARDGLRALLAAGNHEEALLRNCVMGIGYPCIGCDDRLECPTGRPDHTGIASGLNSAVARTGGPVRTLC